MAREIETSQVTFHVPDIQASWPWPRTLHPDWEEAWAASRGWFLSFNVFGAKERQVYEACHIGLLSGLTFALADKEIVRSGCDLLSIFLIFDETTDHLDEDGVRQFAKLYLSAMKHPEMPRPHGETIVGEIVRQFWQRARTRANPRFQRRFINEFEAFTEAVAQQAGDRTNRHFRSIEDYFAVRRGDVGLKPTIVLLLFNLDIDLPDEVLDHPALAEMEMCCVDSIITANDITSYNREQARGDDTHNLVSIVMQERGLDLQSALYWIRDYQEHVTQNFIRLRDEVCARVREDLPTIWNERIEAQLKGYMGGLACWVRGNDAWGWECERYFGKEGMEVKNGKHVVLMPRKQQTSRL
ncbi:terpenoid synthase [Hygrophoropsis aurantiaca]|uniref:Terpenoid synthase n=1 Tax=Hygrophoropsis aurantiaca TaxID=72124 RepID=A0ACB8AQM1_9AGAM|nr:terpenoid synthase [Hygrophoropsis aurantiaca]